MSPLSGGGLQVRDADEQLGKLVRGGWGGRGAPAQDTRAWESIQSP